MMTDNLKKLAKELGVQTSFETMGKTIDVSDDLTAFFCREIGFDALSEEAIQKSLNKIRQKRMGHVLEPIYVVRQNNLSFEVFVPQEDENKDMTLFLSKDKKGEKQKVFFSKNLESQESVSEKTYLKYRLCLNELLPIGYYKMELLVGDKAHKSVLAVAPEKCYEGALKDEKLWGFFLTYVFRVFFR